jgi:hypothetical protein
LAEAFCAGDTKLTLAVNFSNIDSLSDGNNESDIDSDDDEQGNWGGV